MKSKGIVLFLREWELTDDKTGELKKGISVNYVLSDTLRPATNSDGTLGYAIAKVSVPVDFMPKFTAVPGIYDFDLNVSVASGKASIKINDLSYVKSL